MAAPTDRVPEMKKLAVMGLLVLGAGCGPRPAEPASGSRSLGIERYPSARDLAPLAETYRSKHKLPALGLGIIHRGRIAGLGMAGERASGSGDRASLDDAFDVASCAKSVTATIAALLVERNRIRWDTTMSDAFPELRTSMHPAVASASLEQLLRHTAGIHHEMNRNTRWAAWNARHAGRPASEQRLLFVAEAVRRSPRHAPGTDTDYSSDGYVIAGSMLERAAGVSWEELVRTELFRPLRLESARHGVLGEAGTVVQVSGHEDDWLGRPRAIPPDPSEYGVPPFGSPAGFLYGSVPDLLRYVDLHIQGANGRGHLLRPESFRRLHARTDAERYGLGWEVEVRRDDRGRIIERSIYHGGYSGRFRANIWFVPETGWGTAIVMNHGRGDDSITADIFRALLRDFGLLADEGAAP